jgi:hypothetical protein
MAVKGLTALLLTFNASPAVTVGTGLLFPTVSMIQVKPFRSRHLLHKVNHAGTDAEHIEVY